jgi:hypothetical protein
MLGDLEGIIIFIPFLYLTFYLAAWSICRKIFP